MSQGITLLSCFEIFVIRKVITSTLSNNCVVSCMSLKGMTGKNVFKNRSSKMDFRVCMDFSLAQFVFPFFQNKQHINSFTAPVKMKYAMISN